MSTIVTYKNIDDDRKTLLLENRILDWERIVQILVENFPVGKIPEELISKISKVPPRTVAPTNIQDFVKKTCDTWEMTARFLAVALGNIVKNIERIPKYGNSEIENAAEDVKKQYYAPNVRLFRNLIEHEQDYITGIGNLQPEAENYIKNLNFGIQCTFVPPFNEGELGEISFSIFGGSRIPIDPVIRSVKNLKEAIQKKRDSSTQSNICSPS